MATFGFSAPQMRSDAGAQAKTLTTFGINDGAVKAQSGPYKPDTSSYHDTDFRLWQVVRASTAAPTYFPRERTCRLKRIAISTCKIGSRIQPILHVTII